MIDPIAQRATIGTSETDRDRFPLVSLFDALQHIRAVAGCRQSDHHVARLAQRLDLSREDAFVAIVVRNRGKD